MLSLAKPSMYQGPIGSAEGGASSASSAAAAPAAFGSTSSSSPSSSPTRPASIVPLPSPIRPTSNKKAPLRSKQQGSLPSKTAEGLTRPSTDPSLSNLRRAVTFDVPSRGTTPHPPGFMPFFQLDSASAMPLPSVSSLFKSAADTSPIVPQSTSVDISQYGSSSLDPCVKGAEVQTSESQHPVSSQQQTSTGEDISGSKIIGGTYRQSQSFGEYDTTAPDEIPGTKGAAVSSAANVTGKGRRRRRRPAPPELLIIVRPPPSKDRNPLNLQIQLVVPTANTSSRTSGESSRDSPTSSGPPPASSTSGSTPSTLIRRGSSGSSRSAFSERTTASSSSGNTSATRKVTPLYNLAVHSILPTTVSDAGTDQKVARYGKKGTVEIEGFALLEPRELIFGVNDLATLESPEDGRDVAVMGDAMSAISPPDEATADTGVAPASNVEPPTSFEAMTPDARSPELAGPGAKLMKRFRGLHFPKPSVNGNSTTGSIAAGSTASGVSAFLNGLGVASVKTGKQSTSDSTRPVSVAGLSLRSGLSGAAVTRSSGFKPGTELAPLVPGAGLSDHGGRRTQGYVWTFTKLIRKVVGPEGNLPEAPLDIDGQNHVLRNVWRHFNTMSKLGGDERHPHPQRLPVRLEWTREGKHGSHACLSSSTSAGRRATHADRRNRMSVLSVDDESISAGHSAIALPEGTDGSSASLAVPQVDHSRRSPSRSASRDASRPKSVSPRHSADVRSHRGSSAASDNAPGDDDEDYSDPEDSEEPWSCHLALSSSTRIPIATLSPAPHHPKIVAQLAVPFPLPDLSHTGLLADGAGLTREEIKDMICVSALHVVLRESFGGVGRPRRMLK